MRKRNGFFRKAAACLVAAVCACSVLASGAMTQTAEAAEDTWRNTYGVTFEKSGTAVTLAQMKDANELKMICDQYSERSYGRKEPGRHCSELIVPEILSKEYLDDYDEQIYESCKIEISYCSESLLVKKLCKLCNEEPEDHEYTGSNICHIPFHKLWG